MIISTIKTLTINRQKWGFGEKGGYLLDRDTGLQCCLGFFCKKIGYKNSHIENRGTPFELITCFAKQNLKKRLQCLTTSSNNNSICHKLIDVNDSTSPIYLKKPEKREAKIAQLFSKIGVKVNFVGKYKNNLK